MLSNWLGKNVSYMTYFVLSGTLSYVILVLPFIQIFSPSHTNIMPDGRDW